MEALEVTGVGEEVRVSSEAGKGKDNQGLSLTCTPRPEDGQAFLSPGTSVPCSDRVWPVLSAV